MHSQVDKSSNCPKINDPEYHSQAETNIKLDIVANRNTTKKSALIKTIAKGKLTFHVI